MELLLIKLALQNLLFFGLHFEGKNNFPKQLSPREEAECLKKIAEGDEEARDKLIVHNLRLVAYIVNKKYPDCKDADDLVSIGTIGLIRAAETFDCSQNNRFSTSTYCMQKFEVLNISCSDLQNINVFAHHIQIRFSQTHRPFRSSKTARAAAKSSGRVIFILHEEISVIFTRLPQSSSTDASSVTSRSPISAAHFSNKSRRNACGVCA